MDRPIVAFLHPVPGNPEVPGAVLTFGHLVTIPRPQLLEAVRGATVIVTWVTDRVDAELLDAAGPQLKAVCNFAVGYDNIDLEACRARGVMVTNTPMAVNEGTADMAWTLLLAAARGLLPADRYARSDDYPRNGPVGITDFLGMDISGRTLHIVGAGRIGYATALRSLGWGMRVIYTDTERKLEFEMAPLAGKRVSLEDGLREADVVSVHVPLLPTTRHLINRDNMKLMKSTAILINTSRGPTVEEAALVEALASKKIYAAGLDVFEFEPRISAELRALDNVVMTPHIGSAERKWREVMTQITCENAAAVVAGKHPPNRVV